MSKFLVLLFVTVALQVSAHDAVSKVGKPQNFQWVSHKMRELSNEITAIVENFHNERTKDKIVDYVKDFSTHIGVTIDKLQSEAANQMGEAQQIMHQLAAHLDEIRTKLGQSSNIEGIVKNVKEPLQTLTERIAAPWIRNAGAHSK